MSDDPVEALHVRIEASDDPADYLVLADRLIERGDVRGDLIMAQHAMVGTKGAIRPEPAQRAADILAVHSEALLGFIPGADIELSWRLGYVRSAHVRQRVYENPDRLQTLVTALLTHPGHRHLRKLIIDEDQRAPKFRTLLPALREAKQSAPSTLSSLQLGSWHQRNHAHWVTRDFERYYDDLSALWSIFPHLSELTLDLGAAALQFGEIEAKALRRFTWIQPQLDPDELSSLCNARWPQLEEMRLWLGAQLVVNEEEDLDYGDDTDIIGGIMDPEPLAQLLEHLDTLPQLHTLGLVNYCGSWGPLIEAIETHSLSKRLRTLDISGGRLGTKEVDAFAARCRAMIALTRIIASDLRIPQKGFQQLSAAMKTPAFEGTRSNASDPDYLFVAVME